MFEFFGGVPELLIPDNLKTGVTSPSYYEPDLNPAYTALAEHYGCCILPTRPGRPRDKAKVEAGVLFAERRILAALRHRQFFSLPEVKEAVRRSNLPAERPPLPEARWLTQEHLS